MEDQSTLVTQGLVRGSSNLVRSIVVDTVTAIQNEHYMASTRKANHDQWLDKL